jgi:hypothetical protein
MTEKPIQTTYQVSYKSAFDKKEAKQTRNTLQEAVAYALILEARKDLNVEVISIERMNDD